VRLALVSSCSHARIPLSSPCTTNLPPPRSIRVRAEGPGGVGPFTEATGVISNQLNLPVSGAVLYMDTRSMQPTTRLARWEDQSGRANHFTQNVTASQPSVSRATNEPYCGVVFTGSQHLQLPGAASNDFNIDINTPAFRSMSLFALYKPNTATSSGAVVGRAAAS
jgi:hypothetical protein